MEARRSAKSRSIGTESKSARILGRPELGERVHSAPSTDRKRHSQSKRTSDGAKLSAVIARTSKATVRDDPFFRSYDSPQSMRLAEQPCKGSAGPKSIENVRIIPQERQPMILVLQSCPRSKHRLLTGSWHRHLQTIGSHMSLSPSSAVLASENQPSSKIPST